MSQREEDDRVTGNENQRTEQQKFIYCNEVLVNYLLSIEPIELNINSCYLNQKYPFLNQNLFLNGFKSITENVQHTAACKKDQEISFYLNKFCIIKYTHTIEYAKQIYSIILLYKKTKIQFHSIYHIPHTQIV